VLVTGAAGFVGSNLVMEFLRTVEGIRIVGVDNRNDYYDVSLKDSRLAII
jgi:nucleoside-diphosphate-sugar epimerase